MGHLHRQKLVQLARAREALIAAGAEPAAAKAQAVLAEPAAGKPARTARPKAKAKGKRRGRKAA